VPVPAIAVAIVIAIVVGALLYKHRGAEPSAPVAVVEPAAIEIADAQPAATYSQLPAAGAPMAPTARQAVEGIVAARAKAQASHSRSNAHLRQAVGQAYAAEQRDSAWAAAKEDELRKILAGAGMAAAGVTADDLTMQCRSTLCETTAKFSAPGAAEDWVLAYMSSLGSAASSSVVSRAALAGGGTRLTILSKAR